MSEFTYERENTQNTLETFEWDNVWWDYAPNHETPRILAIGDSISCGWRHVLSGLYNHACYVDGFGTSKAVDNPYFMDALCLFAKQQRYRQTILLNNGLHGFHLSTAEYKQHYETLLQNLLNEFPESGLVLLLTTPTRISKDLTRHDERNKLVIERNAAVLALAEKFKLPVIDLYTPLENAPELYSNDGVHLNEKGYLLLANTIKVNLG